MTDARLPGRWLTDMRMFRLSDQAWRVWSYGLMFGAEQGTDGLIDRDAFQFLHRGGVNAGVIDELIAAGLVELTKDGGLQVIDWTGSAGQSLAERVQQQRQANKERQARSRARRREKDMSDSTRDVTRYDGGEDRQGEDRPGQALEDHAGAGARVHDWPVRTPGSEVAS